MPGLRVIAEFNPTTADNNSYYSDMYSGAQFNTNGSPRIAQYPLLVDPATKNIVAFMGNDTRGLPQIVGIASNNYYYHYSYYQDFTSKTSQETYRGFQALQDDTKYLAITPPELSASVAWNVKPGQIAAGSATGVIAFSPQAIIFNPGTAPQELIRAYDYIGTMPTGSGSIFESARSTWDPNYASSKLMARGTQKGDQWATSSLFIAPAGDPRLASANIPLGAYIECNAATGSAGTSPITLNAGTLPNGVKTDYSVTLYDNLVDAKTGASYVAFQDSNGIHFYIPEYQTTDGKTLQSIQDAIKYYLSLTARGDVGLFSPVSIVNLQPIQAVLNVPTAQADTVQQSIISAQQFAYDPVEKRYLYKFTQADTSKVYYPTTLGNKTPAYVDLRSGVLYDANGIPVASALNYPELLLLLSDNTISVPAPNDDPSKYQAVAGLDVVPKGITLTSTTPFLRYSVAG